MPFFALKFVRVRPYQVSVEYLIDVKVTFRGQAIPERLAVALVRCIGELQDDGLLAILIGSTPANSQR
jgi:hypothetical protein